MDTSHLPPDGTYPPRILAPSASIWLKDGETLDMSGKSVIFRRSGKDFYVTPYPNAKHEPMVNGTSMVVERLLKDGDFIHCGKERYIFQADPVADWRKLLSEDPEEIPVYQPTKLLEKWVRFEEEGISLDGGKTGARWSEIVRVEFYEFVGYAPGLRIYFDSENDELLELISKLPPSLENKHDVRQLYIGLLVHFPFQWSASSFGSLIVDAYAYQVYLKLLKPAEELGQLLPAPAGFITGEDEWRQERWFYLIGMTIFLPIGSAVMAFAKMNEDGRLDFGRYFPSYFLAWLITFTIFIAALWAIMWVFMIFPRRLQKLLHKESR